MKKISRTWFRKNNEDSNYIATKRVDSSTFGHGTVIPRELHNIFLDNLSVRLSKGEKKLVTVICNGKKYKSKIDWVNNDEKRRSDDVIRIMFNDKMLKILITEVLEKSYDYIVNYVNETGKKPKELPEEYQEYIDFYKANEKDTFILTLISKTNDEFNDEEDNFQEDTIDYTLNEEIKDGFWKVSRINDEIKYIHKYISSKGFDYSEELIKNFYLSLKTKPFVILSGISGTGKSKIVELFAEAIGANYKNGRFKLVPVKPDWSDATDLLGYRNIESKFTPGIITSVAYEAMKNPDKPYFICLDEMNLARVEYYFSDILSLMETRKLNEDGEIITETLVKKVQFGRGDTEAFDKYGDVYIPENLYIIGTVNMDETTFPFSKKVLDRANTIEFNKVDLRYDFDAIFDDNEINTRLYKNDFLKANYLKLSQCKDEKEIALIVINELISINNILEEYNQHFGFRVRDEIVFYMIYAVKNNVLEFNNALDNCIVQKILPKINGSNGDVLEILIKVFNLLNDSTFNISDYIDDNTLKDMAKKVEESNYKISSEKLLYMIRRFVRDGFTTFWQ